VGSHSKTDLAYIAGFLKENTRGVVMSFRIDPVTTEFHIMWLKMALFYNAIIRRQPSFETVEDIVCAHSNM
jgi:hypothetical protein